MTVKWVTIYCFGAAALCLLFVAAGWGTPAVVVPLVCAVWNLGLAFICLDLDRHPSR